MMNTRRIVVLGLVVLAVLALVLPVRGQTGGIVVNGADATSNWSFVVPATTFPVGPRIIMEYANANQFYGLVQIPPDLLALLRQVGARIIMEYANSNRTYTLSYPADLIGDTMPPQITGVTCSIISSSSVMISWLTNEFADSAVLYGTQPGVYPWTVSDPLYVKLHSITLTGLTIGTTYHYKVRNTDRSGNTYLSPEYICPASPPVYLPAILKNYP